MRAFTIGTGYGVEHDELLRPIALVEKGEARVQSKRGALSLSAPPAAPGMNRNLAAQARVVRIRVRRTALSPSSRQRRMTNTKRGPRAAAREGDSAREEHAAGGECAGAEKIATV